jgi:hypothetical protein
MAANDGLRAVRPLCAHAETVGDGRFGANQAGMPDESEPGQIRRFRCRFISFFETERLVLTRLENWRARKDSNL